MEGAREQDRGVGGVNHHAAAWIAWLLCLVCVALAVASLIFALLNGRTLGEIFLALDGPSIATFAILTVSFSVVGPRSPRTVPRTPSAGSSWPRASAMGS